MYSDFLEEPCHENLTYVKHRKRLIPFFNIQYVDYGIIAVTTIPKPFCSVFYTSGTEVKMVDLDEDEIDTFLANYKNWLKSK